MRTVKLLAKNRLASASLFVVAVIGLVALFAPLIAPYSYAAQDLAHTNELPSPRHLLGTDALGRDVFSRLIYGARISLTVALVVELIELLIGVTFGALAGYYGGKLDLVLMRVTDMMFAFPDILLAILIMSIAGPSIFNIFLALGLVGWPTMARVVRGQVLSLKEKEFVEAARAIGATDRHIILRHILPNTLSPIIVTVTVGMAGVILAEATLSFLGIGVQPPQPSWGSMINDARDLMRSHPALIVFPSLALSVTVLAFNFLGDGLRDALDPRMKGV